MQGLNRFLKTLLWPQSTTNPRDALLEKERQTLLRSDATASSTVGHRELKELRRTESHDAAVAATQGSERSLAHDTLL